MKQSKPSISSRKSPVLASLVLACAIGTMAPNAHAAAFDAPAFGQRLVEFAGTWGQRIKEVTQWGEQIKHYAQQLPNVGNMLNPSSFNLLGGTPLDNLKKRPLDYGMTERCGSQFNFDIKSLLGGLASAIGIGGNYVEQQRKICSQIVTLENSKYNDLVDALEDLDKLKKKGLDKNVQNASGATKSGQTDVTQVSATNVNGEIQALHTRIETTTMVYDQMIQSLQTDMKTVATTAMSGSKKKDLLTGALGQVVSVGSLKLTLSALKSNCPSGFTCN